MIRLLQLLIVAAFCLLFQGCGNSSKVATVEWIVERRPETDAERELVAKHEAEILKNVPTTFAGHDQDWYEVVATTHKIAVDTYCKSRLYEQINGRFTGQCKEIK